MGGGYEFGCVVTPRELALPAPSEFEGSAAKEILPSNPPCLSD